MSTKINLLFVEDHTIIISGYKYAINALISKENYEYNFIETASCQEGYEAIINATEPFDVAFLDLNMPPYPEKGIHSGEDLAFLLKEKMPNCRIVILSMTLDMDKMLSFIDTINPKGLVVKSDLDHKFLVRGFAKIMEDSYYYSKTIINILRKSKVRDGYEFDQYDDEIIKQMTLGVTRNKLHLYVPLTFENVEVKYRTLNIHFKNEYFEIKDLLKILRKRKIIRKEEEWDENRTNLFLY